MKLQINKTKTDTHYFIASTIREKSKTRTVNIMKIGSHSELIKEYANPLDYARGIVMAYNSSTDERLFNISLVKDTRIRTSSQISKYSSPLNIGYFYLQDIYNKLDLKAFFNKITNDSKIKYNPNLVTKFLTYSRILDPQSKSSTFDSLDTYYEQPNFKTEDIFKTMDLIYDNIDELQTHLYENSQNIINRNTKVLYYDLTNFFFESILTDELREYGLSKEHRPNPIVQMGLFLDGDGIPLAFDITPGNTNEQRTVKPFEKRIIKDFKLSNFIYVSDAGCNSNDTKLFNSFNGRNYVVTQSIKKLKGETQKIIFDDDNWYYYNKRGIPIEVTLSDIKGDPSNLNTYYKSIPVDNPIDVGIKIDNTKKLPFKQRLIVSYSNKYRNYQMDVLNKQIERASKKINTNRLDSLNANDVNRLINVEHTTNSGEASTNRKASLNLKRIQDEMKYHGYYGVITSIDDLPVYEVLNVNTRRWEIEESFRIMKTNFKARPVYHHKDVRIKSHFAICFLALLIYRLLERKLDNKYTTNEIISSLKNMTVTPLDKAYYISNYTSSEILGDLNKSFNKELDKDHFTNTILNKNK